MVSDPQCPQADPESWRERLGRFRNTQENHGTIHERSIWRQADTSQSQESPHSQELGKMFTWFGRDGVAEQLKPSASALSGKWTDTCIVLVEHGMDI